MLAVVRVAERASPATLAAGDAAIREAIENTKWTAAGAPAIRLYSGGPLHWLTGGCEVAVPVVSRW